MKSKKKTKTRTGLAEMMPKEVGRTEIAAAAAVCVVFFFLTSHPDIWETANHSYVFLESLFSGKALDFYGAVAAHNNSYYYLNYANYNICMYVLFGAALLPMYLINALFGISYSEVAAIYIAKAVCVVFFVLSGKEVYRISLALGTDREKAGWAMLFYLFNPISFYAVFIMGQYDVIGLFFMLRAVSRYLEGDMKGFCLFTGISAVFKFFALLVFLPLLLLERKKIKDIILCALASLWLYIPTTLIYMGRTGNAARFTGMMVDRLFETTLNTGLGEVAVFPLAYAVMLFICFRYSGDEGAGRKEAAIYVPLFVFCLMFLTIYWHPQWIILMVPFMVMTTFLGKERQPWLYLDIVIGLGFILLTYIYFPTGSGAVLFDGGVLHHLFGKVYAMSPHAQRLSFFLALVPHIREIASVMFCGGCLLHMILKFPRANGRTGAEPAEGAVFDRISLKANLIGIFVIVVAGAWLVPSLFEWLNGFGVI